MAYKIYTTFTEDLYDRWIAEGRGSGQCASYVPWLQPGDVPTKRGHFERYVCPKSQRQTALLSGVESWHRLFYDSCLRVAYVHEQVPLDRERTRHIAKSLGIDHPIDSKTRVDVVMTTDHLVHVRQADGTLKKYPRSSKSHSSVLTFNDSEHAEIEHRYWLEMEAEPWKMITDSLACIPQVLKDNLEKLKPWRTPPMHEDTPGNHALLRQEVKAELLGEKAAMSVGKFCLQLDAKRHFPTGTSATTFYFLVFNNQLIAHLHLTPLLNQSVQDIGARTRIHDEQQRSEAKQ